MPAKKPVWERPNPKKKSKPLTAAQKTKAKAAAKKAGRKYPNLVDNMRASRGR
jgi:ribosomal protein L15E